MFRFLSLSPGLLAAPGCIDFGHACSAQIWHNSCYSQRSNALHVSLTATIMLHCRIRQGWIGSSAISYAHPATTQSTTGE